MYTTISRHQCSNRSASLPTLCVLLPGFCFVCSSIIPLSMQYPISLVTNEIELTSLQVNISHLAITFKKYLFIFWTTFFYCVFLFLVTCRNPSYIWNMIHVLEIYIANIFSHLYCLITLLMFYLFYLMYHKKK